jgi:hypothetical protein
VTPRVDARRGARRGALAALTALVIGLTVALATACSGGGSDAQVVEIVVPAGTQARLDAGEQVVVMPTRLELHVGDTLVIRNDDDVAQSVGPYRVAANAEMRLTYGATGVYEGYCPLSEDQRYEIVVTP